MADFSKYKYYKGEKENPWEKYKTDNHYTGQPEWFYNIFWFLEKIRVQKGDKEFEKYRHRVFGKWIAANEINGTYYFVDECTFRYDDYHGFTDTSYINLDKSLNMGKLIYDDDKRVQSKLFERDEKITLDEMGDIKFMRPETDSGSVQEIYKTKRIEATSK